MASINEGAERICRHKHESSDESRGGFPLGGKRGRGGVKEEPPDKSKGGTSWGKSKKEKPARCAGALKTWGKNILKTEGMARGKQSTGENGEDEREGFKPSEEERQGLVNTFVYGG